MVSSATRGVVTWFDAAGRIGTTTPRSSDLPFSPLIIVRISL